MLHINHRNARCACSGEELVNIVENLVPVISIFDDIDLHIDDDQGTLLAHSSVSFLLLLNQSLQNCSRFCNTALFPIHYNLYHQGCVSFFCTQEGGDKIKGKNQERETRA